MQLPCLAPPLGCAALSPESAVRTPDPGLASAGGGSCAQLPFGGHTGQSCSAVDTVDSEGHRLSCHDVCGDEVLSQVGRGGDPGGQWGHADPQHQQADTLRAADRAQAEAGLRGSGQGRQEEVTEAEETLDEQWHWHRLSGSKQKYWLSHSGPEVRLCPCQAAQCEEKQVWRGPGPGLLQEARLPGVSRKPTTRLPSDTRPQLHEVHEWEGKYWPD